MTQTQSWRAVTPRVFIYKATTGRWAGYWFADYSAASYAAEVKEAFGSHQIRIWTVAPTAQAFDVASHVAQGNPGHTVVVDCLSREVTR